MSLKCPALPLVGCPDLALEAAAFCIKEWLVGGCTSRALPSWLAHGHASALSCCRDMAVQLTDDVGNISPCCTVGGRLADKQIAICRSGLGPPASAGNGLSIARLQGLAVQVHCQLRLQRPVV